MVFNVIAMWWLLLVLFCVIFLSVHMLCPHAPSHAPSLYFLIIVFLTSHTIILHTHHSNKNDHFFLAGTLLINLLLRTAYVHKRNSSSTRSRSRGATDAESQAMEQLNYEARSLQHSLLTTMMGERLCRNFDWTLSALDAMEDDVSDWVQRLSVLERNMFIRGVYASGAVKSWREYGCTRMGVSLAVIKGRGMGATPSANVEKTRVVTPTNSSLQPGKSF